MTTHLPMNHYGCTYYCINEDPYIMKDKEKKGPLEFFLCYLNFSLPFFILYNTLLAREFRQTKSQNQ